MGIVYEARHTKTNNRVALKTLLTGGDGQQINADKLYRFRKEFRRLSEINHPNLVGMQSLEVDGDRWFFTMDLIDGEDFLSYVRPDDPFDETRLRSCLKQLATGVQELHRRGIIHRDLKPSNVLVSQEGHVTILDFGLAAQLQRSGDMTQTKSGMFAGTPPYAAPEQMFGERTEASDWYAFGTMLFEALAGERPFQDSDPMKLLRMKQEQDPPQLADRDSVPSDLSALADGLLRREPGLRLLSDAIGAVLGLEEETRIPGSTRGSQGSAGSANAGDAELEEFEEDEIVLIGREKQLAELEEIKREFLETLEPMAVWVTGLSGEGKSSLVDAFLQSIRKSGATLVFSGRCYDRESIPFKVIDSFMDPLVRQLRTYPDAEINALLPSDIAALSHLFPSLRRVKAIAAKESRLWKRLDDKLLHNLAFAALRDLLSALSEANPIVLHVDDLQWGDADSAEIFARILAPPSPPRVLFIGSVRSDERVDSAFLREWFENREKEQFVYESEINVEPLSESECRQFVESRIGSLEKVTDQDVSDLYASSLGNPYFLEQLIEGFRDGDGKFSAAPLETMTRVRLSRCPDLARELLDLIAIAGKAVPIDEVACLTKASNSPTPTLTRMRSERLVRLIGSQSDQLVDTYHDKIRESVLSLMNKDRRRELHLLWAEAIEISGTQVKLPVSDDSRQLPVTRVFDLAYHFHQAGDTRAFKFQLAAGRHSLEAGAMEAALEHLKGASQIATESITDSERFQLHYSLGRALAGCGYSSEAISEYQQASVLSSEPVDRAKCLQELGDVLWSRAEYDDGLKQYERAFTELGERLPSTRVGRLLGAARSMASIHLLPRWISAPWKRKSDAELILLSQYYDSLKYSRGQQDVTTFLLSAVRCCSFGRRIQSPLERYRSLASYAWLPSWTGLSFLARRILREAEAGLNIEGDLQQKGELLASMGMAYYGFGQLEKAKSFLGDASRIFSRLGSYSHWGTQHILWHIAAIQGDPVSVVRYASTEGDLARSSGDRIVFGFSCYGLAEGWARQGELTLAQKNSETAIAELKSADATFLVCGYIQQARVYLQGGQYDQARLAASSALRDIPKLRFFELTVAAFAVYLEALLGDRWYEYAERLPISGRLKATAALMFARLSGWLFPPHKAPGLRMKGRFAARRGKIARARKYFGQAAKAAAEVGASYEQARSLIDGSMLDYPDATADRHRGIDLLESLGCVLPDAEIEYLGIDREAHHARAAEARTKHESELQQ